MKVVMASDKAVETVIVGNYVEMETEGKPKSVKNKLSNFFWHGGSAYDAWFSCASNQVFKILNDATLDGYICKIIVNSYSCFGFLMF